SGSRQFGPIQPEKVPFRGAFDVFSLTEARGARQGREVDFVERLINGVGNQKLLGGRARRIQRFGGRAAAGPEGQRREKAAQDPRAMEQHVHVLPVEANSSSGWREWRGGGAGSKIVGKRVGPRTARARARSTHA